jgi:hypothetical protein
VKATRWLVGLLFLMGAAELAAQESETWKAWQYSRRILTQGPTEPQLARVALPMEIYAHAQLDLDDLRVIDDEGTEVPFVLHAVQGGASREWRNTLLTDVGFVPGRFTHAIVDAGRRQELHNLLELQFDEKDFFSWLEIAASDDRTTWHILRDRAPLYRFHDDGVERVSNVAYPQTHARWLRLRILDKDKRLLPRHGRVAYEVVEEVERTPAPVTFTKVEPALPRESQWQVDLGNALIPLSAVRFEATQSEFHRAVRIAISEDGNTWMTRCRGDIHRYRYTDATSGEGRERASLEVSCPESQARFWRVTVLDRNDSPVVGLHPIPEQVTRAMVFRQHPLRSYRLLYGHSRVPAAQYDLTRLLHKQELKSASTSRLGPEELNKNYITSEAWTEQHPVLLWTALVIVVAVLGAQAVRAIR